MEDEQLFLLLGFYTVLVEFYTGEVLRFFLPYGFLEENICVLLCSLVFSCVATFVFLSVILCLWLLCYDVNVLDIV